MAESVTIVCDGCGERVGKAHRTKVRPGREPIRRAAMDLCPDCLEKVLSSLRRPAKPRTAVAKTLIASN